MHVGSWGDAIWHFEREKIDAGLPLTFHYSDYTTMLLTINWRVSKKRILSAIAQILDRSSPATAVSWNARGRKNSDMLVALERIAIMRLLHQFTLAEMPMKAPEAWRLYQRRKWYDERRRALKDFRRRSGYADAENVFPVSWQTKADQRVSEATTK